MCSASSVVRSSLCSFQPRFRCGTGARARGRQDPCDGAQACQGHEKKTSATTWPTCRRRSGRTSGGLWATGQ
eukprot:5656727-Pyramimonas_sp.AAC.1